jgi:nicotinamide-nucleotide amidase
MKAEIIAVGSELLRPERSDTNSLFITERLNEIGIDVKAKSIVGDDRATLHALVEGALARSEIVITTGGLGPTEDDLTREVVATALGLQLEIDERIVERIRARFASRGLRMPDINRRQAEVPRGAVVLDNPNGTAPGLWIERGDRIVILLPGPPREMRGMFESIVRERLSSKAGLRRLYRRVLRVTGRTESHTEEVVAPSYARWAAGPGSIETTILASYGQIELHLTAQSPDVVTAETALDAATAEVQALLGADLYSTDGRTMEQVVGDLLRKGSMKIAVAESCTGGLLASRLTDVPGSSDYVERGIVAYSNAAKVELLGVPAEVIEEHGAVSEPTAIAMARGICLQSGAAIGIGVTGIAGPGGGTERKPVGMVCIAVARPGLSPSDSHVRTFRFLGGRGLVKSQASQAGLDMVRRWLLEVP